MMIIIITIFKIHKDNNLDILKSTKHQKYFISAIRWTSLLAKHI